MKLCILDTKSANLNSVVQAIKRLGIDPVITADINTLNQADKLILPGVGTALAVMSEINDGNLYDFILNTKKPLLGICLGMQVLGAADVQTRRQILSGVLFVREGGQAGNVYIHS